MGAVRAAGFTQQITASKSFSAGVGSDVFIGRTQRSRLIHDVTQVGFATAAEEQRIVVA